MPICRICGYDERERPFVAFEMMFGTKEPFEYFECSICGCIQICEYPLDITRYYPRHYYAYRFRNHHKSSALRVYLRKKRMRAYLEGVGILGRLLLVLKGAPSGAIANWLKEANVKTKSRILDVGCGDGAFLAQLRALGFHNSLGIDPYLEEGVIVDPLVRIERKHLTELDEDGFDFVTLHHTLEHMRDQLKVFRDIKRILKRDGHVLIRTPVKGFAWQRYGINWVQLDAPRHLYIHTENSLRRLAAMAGLTVKKVVYDSSEFMFWGSEQYVAGIPLCDPTSYSENREKSIFSPNQMEEFRRQASELNLRGMGDQACFYLRRA